MISRTARSGNRAFGYVLLELFLIFISVFLAFSLGQYQEARRDRQLAETALHNIEQEIRANLADIEASLEVHNVLIPQLRQMAEADMDGKTAFGVFLEQLQGQNLKIPVLEQSAWDAAIASGAVQQMDYELLASISSLYNTQTLGVGKTVSSTSDFLWDANMFDESRALPQTRALAMLLQNLLGNEIYYVDECHQVLEQLEALR